MKKKFLILTAILSIGFSAFSAERFISGGAAEVPDGKWDGVIGLKIHDAKGFSVCTGTIIAPDIVLTAAHCVYNTTAGIDVRNTPDKIEIMSGPKMLNTVSVAEKAVVHENWIGKNDGSNFSSDIAVLKLATSTTIIPHKITSNPPQSFVEGAVVGYGVTKEDLMDDMVKREGRSKILQIDNNIIMLGNPNGTCVGDSGGPFFIEENGEFVVYGITSFGYQVCDPMKDNFDTNVFVFNFWVTEKVGELSEAVIPEPDDDPAPVDNEEPQPDNEPKPVDNNSQNDNTNPSNDSNTAADTDNAAGTNESPDNTDVPIADDTSACGCSLIF